MIEKLVQVGILFDFYGNLLTKKQYLAIDLYYINDLSLAEIGERIGDPFLVRAMSKALNPLLTKMRDTGLVAVPAILCVLMLSGMPPIQAGIFAVVATIGMVCCSVLSILLSVMVYEWLRR